ncbi:MAG: T9SS type A sorting domain-containing protein [Flavobacteriales bacterium]
MKKLLLLFAITFGCITANAQCTPDPQYTIVGIYPDSSIGMPNALVGQSYNEVITIISPLDTTVALLGQMIPVTIIDIVLDSVNGLPVNFDYTCDAPNCIFAGGSTSCAVLFSTIDPTISDVGLYQIYMHTTTSADAGIFGVQTQNDVIDYYYIEVSNSTSLVNQFDPFTFELRDVYPNPVNNQSIIQFITGEPKSVIFSVFNYLGEKMDEQIIAANRGVNDIFINANSYPNGIYLYSINNGKEVLSKTMIISK